MKDNPLRDSALVSALNSALEGRAAHWLTQIVTGDEFTWPKCRELFITRFGSKETATTTLMNTLREPQQEDENMAAYAIRVRSLLETKWQNATVAEIINAVVLNHLSPRDHRIEQIAVGKDIKTKDQFLEEMRAVAFAKRPASPTSDPPTGPEAKRFKPSASRSRCHYCGALGHKLADCRRRIKSGPPKNARRPEGGRPAAPSKVFCFRCRGEGHIASDCPSPRERASDSDNTRRVDVCAVESPTGELSHRVAHEDA
ncbi:uncharacterized protein LOC117165179 isoform X2 [Bombus vancouverensis nearcticus]|uniref:uncharacterized protein LOC117165179 isoform X2 n=1 Tax=Bombus vancouverensis nearcticus TaxID=2705178 RepID=UPI00402BE211